jgi:hypothetical protein
VVKYISLNNSYFSFLIYHRLLKMALEFKLTTEAIGFQSVKPSDMTYFEGYHEPLSFCLVTYQDKKKALFVHTERTIPIVTDFFLYDANGNLEAFVSKAGRNLFGRDQLRAAPGIDRHVIADYWGSATKLALAIDTAAITGEVTHNEVSALEPYLTACSGLINRARIYTLKFFEPLAFEGSVPIENLSQLELRPYKDLSRYSRREPIATAMKSGKMDAKIF